MSLPAGYKRLTHIESTGTQYINTRFKANQNTRLKMKFTYNGGDVVFGAYNAGGAAAYALQAVSNKWYTYYGNSNANSSIAATVGQTYEVDMNKNTTYIDGALARTATVNTFTGSYPILLSCLYNGTSGAGVFTSLRICSCQIYNNGTLVRDYIPCETDTGDVGLWDDASSEFYGNDGAGVFEAGEIVNPLEPIDPIPFPIPLLITDRTATDVAIVKQLAAKGFDNMTAAEQTQWLDGLKGAYNATDLNRVESAVLYLSNALGALPTAISDYAASKGVAWDSIYNVPYDPTAYTVTTKTDWRHTDIPLPSDMVRYLANIVLLRSALNFNTVDLPPDMDNLTYTEANAIERVLFDLDGAINALQTLLIGYINNAALSWFYSGEVYSGEVDA